MYRRKRREFLVIEVIVLHDKTTFHIANLTEENFEERHLTTLEYSPKVHDLFTCDYHIFRCLNKALGHE